MTPPTEAVLLEIRDLLVRLVAAAERGAVQRPKAPAPREPVTPERRAEIDRKVRARLRAKGMAR